MADDRNHPETRTPLPRRDTDPPASPEVQGPDHLKRHDPSVPASSATARASRWGGDEVTWVRACDALVQTSGRATGRGITWTEQVNRLPRLAPLRQAGTGRRAIARASATSRTSQLAPITAFGVKRDASMARTGVSR